MVLDTRYRERNCFHNKLFHKMKNINVAECCKQCDKTRSSVSRAHECLQQRRRSTAEPKLVRLQKLLLSSKTGLSSQARDRLIRDRSGGHFLQLLSAGQSTNRLNQLSSPPRPATTGQLVGSLLHGIRTKMMRHADNYKESNSLQRVDTRSLLKEVLPLLSWDLSNGPDTVLDIGCGPGDVTADLLLPALPSTATVWGVDLGESLIKHAKSKHTDDRLKFSVADFGSDNIKQYLPLDHFSKVFSFYCLHWIYDQRQVMRNLRQVLRPGGQAVLRLMAKITGMTAFRMLSKMEQWSPYLKGIDKFFPFYESACPSEDMKAILEAEGLEVELCEDRLHHHTYPSLDVLIDSFMAVNPWVSSIPSKLLEKYRADLTRVVLDNNLCEVLPDSRARLQYSSLVVVCRKPANKIIK